MREDFVTRLQLQLRDAAEREAHGRTLGHALRGARWRLGAPALAGAVAALALLLGIGAGALLLRDDAAPAGPRVLAELRLTGNPEQLLPAFGSVWIADPVAGAVVRVDPERRVVTARIPVGATPHVTMSPVGGQLWASGAQPGDMVRIDPATSRVVGTVKLRDLDGRAFQPRDVLANDRAVWAVSPEGAIRLDPRTGAAQQEIATLAGGNEARWFALGENTLWVYGTDGTIRRFDATTGAPEGRLRPQLEGTQWFGDLAGDLIAGNSDGRLARLDGRTGAIRWLRVMGELINASEYGAGLSWSFVTSPGEPARLVALDPRNGAVVSSTTMPIFGATGLTVVGDEVWVDDAGGRTLVVGR